MELKVIFSLDPTGQAQDIEQVIEIPNDTCLYCNHDHNQNIDRFVDEIKKALELKGFDLEMWFTLFKVYTI